MSIDPYGPSAVPTVPHTAPSDPSGPREHANGVNEPTLDRAPATLRRGDARGGMVSDRTEWLDLPKPHYDNLEFRAWLDFPKTIDDIRLPPAPNPDGTPSETPEQQNDRLVFFCQQVVLDCRAACTHGGDPNLCTQEHGPWLNRDGQPMLHPETREFWDQLSTPLGGAIMTRFWAEVRENPTNRASRRWKQKASKRR